MYDTGCVIKHRDSLRQRRLQLSTDRTAKCRSVSFGLTNCLGSERSRALLEWFAAWPDEDKGLFAVPPSIWRACLMFGC